MSWKSRLKRFLLISKRYCLPRRCGVDNQVKTSLSQLRQFVHGINLLGMCPNNVNARIISKGERVSIQLMKAVLEAKGQKANLIDPVEYLYAKGDHLEAWWMLMYRHRTSVKILFLKIM